MSSVAAARPASSMAERNNFARRHQGLVGFFARKYLGRGLSFEDLMQIGNIGLTKAINEFDPARGCRFSTCAATYIRNEIASAVKTHKRHQKDSISLNEPIFHDDSNGPTLMDRLLVTEPNQEIMADLKDTLPRLLAALSPWETRALELTFSFEMTLVEAGEIMGVSRERARQLQEEAIRKIQEMDSGSRKVTPYLTWLNDRQFISVLQEIMEPAERQLFEMTYLKWISAGKAACNLGKTPVEVRQSRKRLAAKLAAIHQSCQSRKIINPPYKTEKILTRLILLRMRMENGEIPRAESLEALSRELGVVFNTLNRWMAASERIRSAVKTLLTKDKDPGILPAEKRAEVLARGYAKLAAADRDLGRNPVLIFELAAAASYGARTILTWITEDPGIIGENFVMYLKRGHPPSLILEHRRRRLRWALDFARAQGLKYKKIGEFGRLRLNINRHTPYDWISEDPEILKIMAEYPDVLIQGLIDPGRALAA